MTHEKQHSDGLYYGVDDFFIEVFLESYSRPPSEIIPDWMPPMTLCTAIKRVGSFMATTTTTVTFRYISFARLRPSDIDASAGSVKELDRIVRQIRSRWPDVRIVIRGDSGFPLCLNIIE